MDEQQLNKIKSDPGFIAALDQSGGSTPKALKLYGIDESEYSGDDEMFDLIHQMRSRIITNSAFNGERIVGAILFEQTMDREIEGKGTAEFLWQDKGVVPFLKIDKGLEDEVDGVQLMKPNPGLDALLERAKAKGVFGTKMRSVIKVADEAGVTANVAQQFEVGKQILSAGLVPIIEPEVDINSTSKAAAEQLLKARILAELDSVDGQIMLKLTLPEEDGFTPSSSSIPRCSVSWPCRVATPRRSEPSPGTQPRRDRQLLPRLHRRPLGSAVRRGVHEDDRRFHPEHLRRLQHLTIDLASALTSSARFG